MKNVKKYPKKQLEKYSSIFMQLSLVLVLFVVYQIIEHETEQKKLVLSNIEFDYDAIYQVDEPLQNFKKEEVKKKVPVLKKQIVDLTKIEKIKNNVASQNVIVDLPNLEDEEIKIEAAFSNYVEPIDDDKLYEDVPFVLIEDAPIYKGCEGLSKEDNRKCFVRSIQKFIIKKFNVELAQDLGLASGRYKIFAQFVISKSGNIEQIKIKAPHKRLKKEVNSIVKMMPKFTPGMQRKVPVNVKFTLPITFSVE